MRRLIQSEARLAARAPATPAYVYSERALHALASDARDDADRAGCRLLYTLKACALAPVLRTLAAQVDGFACSSVYEARIARGAARGGMSLHCYSPAFSEAEMARALAAADFVSLNSFSQLDTAARLAASLPAPPSLGIRVNPEIGFAADERYDPCRPMSKLGVPLSAFAELARRSGAARFAEGVHVHNNCESEDFGELARTAAALEPALDALPNLRWVNLGGGYFFGDGIDAAPLASAAARLKSSRGVDVFIEPGTALVQSAGFLAAAVLDVFPNGDADVAVLDASTSHMPEAFEYGFSPEAAVWAGDGDSSYPYIEMDAGDADSLLPYIEMDAGDADSLLPYIDTDDGKSGASRPTLLAGRSCLAGDVFGRYRARRPLSVGARVVLMDAGAYAHSRAAPFNGIPIPAAFLMRADGAFVSVSDYGFADFARLNGAPESA